MNVFIYTKLSFVGILTALFLSVVSAVPVYGSSRYATVTGRVVDTSGSPISSGRMAIFRIDIACAPDIKGINRVPDAVAQLDDDGRFHVELGPAAYFLGAVDLTQNSYGGALLNSRNFYLAYGKGGAARIYNIGQSETVDLGEIQMSATERKGDDVDLFSIRGRVVNQKGEPVSGAVIMAKENFDDIRPRFISLPTENDGIYLLRMVPGSYRLIARMQETSLGRPAPNELFGVYGERRRVGLQGEFRKVYHTDTVVSGDVGVFLDNKDIVMFPIPDAEEIKNIRQAP